MTEKENINNLPVNVEYAQNKKPIFTKEEIRRQEEASFENFIMYHMPGNIELQRKVQEDFPDIFAKYKQ